MARVGLPQPPETAFQRSMFSPSLCGGVHGPETRVGAPNSAYGPPLFLLMEEPPDLTSLIPTRQTTCYGVSTSDY